MISIPFLRCKGRQLVAIFDSGDVMSFFIIK